MEDSFAERWARKEHECGFEAIRSPMIACGSDVLPERAAPGLDFSFAACSLPIWEVFAAPEDFSPAERARLAPYRVIGSEGAGDPICVVLDSGEVIQLDHDDWFRTLTFVNSSVEQLAECLLAYLGEQDAARFRATVATIDPPAIAERTFWWVEATNLADV